MGRLIGIIVVVIGVIWGATAITQMRSRGHAFDSVFAGIKSGMAASTVESRFKPLRPRSVRRVTTHVPRRGAVMQLHVCSPPRWFYYNVCYDFRLDKNDKVVGKKRRYD
ncbi:MAG: hypothetical protein M1133_08900 [Armatimonadetes bacterium]|nr:hypothetical protein [Armatimonadota bacterium]